MKLHLAIIAGLLCSLTWLAQAQIVRPGTVEGGGSGSGFPLAGDADASGHSITGVGSLEATNVVGNVIEADALYVAGDSVLDLLGLKLDSGTTLSSIAEGAGRLFAGTNAFSGLHLVKVPTLSSITNTGTTPLYDHDGAPVQIFEISGDTTIGETNRSVVGVRELPRIVLRATEATNCALTMVEGWILAGEQEVGGIIPTEILPGEEIFLWPVQFEDEVKFHWRGQQSTPLSLALGGTAVTTGVAPAGKDVLGSVTYSSTTNAEIDFASGTIFTLDNTKDNKLNSVASRLAAGESSSYGRMRFVQMLPPSADRIVWINTNNFGLRGLEHSNYVASGTPFGFWAVNYDDGAGDNYVIGGGAGAAGGAGEESGLLPDLLVCLEFEDSGSPAVDSSGNGYNFSQRLGTYTWQNTANAVGTYCITNNADNSLGLTNASPALQIAGATGFAVSLWLNPGDGASASAAVLTRYDASSASLRSWAIILSSGFYRVNYHTTGAGTQNFVTTVPVTADWQHVFFVYDPDDPDGPTIRLSKNGGSFAEKILDAELSNPSVPLCIGAYTLAGDVSSGESPIAFDQFSYWGAAKDLSIGQQVYAGSAGKEFSTW